MPIKQFSRVQILNNPYELKLYTRIGTIVWGDSYEHYVVRLDRAALGRDVYGQPAWYPEVREHEKNLAVISEPPGE